MGIIVLSLAILPLLGIGGMQLFKAEVPGPTADKITPRVHQTAKYLWLVYFGLTFAQTILLWFGGMDLFDSVCHSFATLATGGFSTKNASVGAFDSAYIDYVIIFFMFAAGVNFALHFNFFTGKLDSYFKDFEFKTYLGLNFCIALILVCATLINGNYNDFADSFRYSLFQTVSLVTTTGFGTADFELWPVFAQLICFLLFFTGGCAGSTGGGTKIVRITVLVKHAFIELKQLLHPQAIIQLRLGERVIKKTIVSTIIGFFIIYLIMFLIFTLILTMFNIDIVTSLSCSASCLGNIGPGLGNIGPTENYGWLPDAVKWLLSFAMMIGRLELFTVLVIFTPSFWKK